MGIRLFSFRKKAMIDVGPTEFVGIVLGFIIFLGLIYLGAKLTGILTSKQEYEATINNFNVIVTRINRALLSDAYESNIITYNIPDDYIIVGFSYDDSINMRTECTDEEIVVSRPPLCHDASCLCIYKDQGSFLNIRQGRDFDLADDSNPVRCNKFDDNIVFISQSGTENGFMGRRSGWQPDYYPGANYEFLVLYGSNCDIGTDFGINQIYLEKFKTDDNTFIFMAEYSEDPESDVFKRKAYMEATYTISS